MGFNALAIDQRSGGSFANRPNETYNQAIQNGIKSIDYTDVIQDDIERAKQFYDKVFDWGFNSYAQSSKKLLKTNASWSKYTASPLPIKNTAPVSPYQAIGFQYDRGYHPLLG